MKTRNRHPPRGSCDTKKISLSLSLPSTRRVRRRRALHLSTFSFLPRSSGALFSFDSFEEEVLPRQAGFCCSVCCFSTSGSCLPCRRLPRGCGGGQAARGGTTGGGDGFSGGGDDDGKLFFAPPSCRMPASLRPTSSPSLSSPPRSPGPRATTRSSRSPRERECSKACASPTLLRLTISR